MKIWGNVCIRDGIRLDYPFFECIKSLLPVCDYVSVCDGQSTDGTQELIREWMRNEPKIVLCVYEWPHPKGDVDFWVKWLNYNREHTNGDFQIQLDADEILSENSYDEVLRRVRHAKSTNFSLWCKRFNFYRDDRHLIPHGVCLSNKVVRIAPRDVWMPSDGPHPNGHACVNMANESNIEIYHYGFLRHREAYFAKCKDLQKFFFNTYDDRLVKAEADSGNWMENCDVGWQNNLDTFQGEHPKIIQQWLADRANLCPETLTIK